ncbi:TRAFAC clade GTPase domain-containing protein [Ruminiclostridium cellobioparum]|uniref:Double-GTPase 2 domain-containing protein n=1 Tax=Ruminiclostridium cellobioparum subsp. termitidis CT1112 TaxID=1195236 RepID=S0FQS0_RUMCE|nr:hypothetical protein [Ruminiclostridium cellobioparum]EMS72716.1 hypothetical protein CTER_1510 [Ruminiclostridium cellobioparum subsp. termitidis CT1112]
MDENAVERDTENLNGLENKHEKNGEETTVVPLPIGRELSAIDTYPVSATERSRFFVIVGATGSGKTTLITSIYHFFLLGSYKDQYLFAGSKTLAAFEERAFYLRTTSMHSNVEMRRTPRGSIDSILHLRIKKLETDEIENLLFSDFSGEDYSGVSANVVAATEDFPIIGSASHIVLLLDGEKTASKKYRLAELQHMIHILRAFWDGHLVKKGSQIIIAVSKYDLVLAANDSSFDKFMQSILDKIIEQIPDLRDRCTLHLIASMPNDTTKLAVGYGIDKLLDALLDSPQYCAYKYDAPSLESQFNLWKRRMA